MTDCLFKGTDRQRQNQGAGRASQLLLQHCLTTPTFHSTSSAPSPRCESTSDGVRSTPTTGRAPGIRSAAVGALETLPASRLSGALLEAVGGHYDWTRAPNQQVLAASRVKPAEALRHERAVSVPGTAFRRLFQEQRTGQGRLRGVARPTQPDSHPHQRPTRIDDSLCTLTAGFYPSYT